MSRLATNTFVNDEATTAAPDFPIKETETDSEREPENSRKNS